VLDGANDSVAYKMQGWESNDANISFVIEFWPDFDCDDGENRYFLSGDFPKTYILKNSSNNMLIRIGSVTIATISCATLQTAWLTGQRNTLVISSTSGDTNAWLNTTQILTSDSSAWSPSAISNFVVGTFNVGATGANFDGTIGRVLLFRDALLTEQEAIDYYEQTTWSYMDNAILHLPMRMAEHDPDNTRTLDVSGNGNHATIAGGVTKRSERGYDFTGGYLATTSGAIQSTGSLYTVAFIVSKRVSGLTALLRHGASGAREGFEVFQSATDNLRLRGGASASPTVDIGVDPHQHHTCVCIADNTTGQIAIDGEIVASGPIAQVGSGAGDVGVMAYENGSSPTTGSNHHYILWDRCLTPTQVADLHVRMMQGLHHV
jgi:hypothetical protein